MHPLLAVARALLDRGHEVALMTSRAQAAAVTAAGVAYLPPQRAPDRDYNRLADTFPGLAGLPNAEVLVRLLWETAVGDAPAQAYDLALAARALRADLLVNDGITLGVPLAAAALRLPWATVSPFIFCTLPDPDLPPPFFGLPLGPGPAGRARAAAAERLLELRLAAAAQRWRALAAAWRLPAPAASLRAAGASPRLNLYPGGPALEYPRRRPLPQVRLVGPLLHEHGDPPAPPGGRPRLFLTEGTTHTDLRLARLALAALAREPLELLLALPAPDAARRLGPLPPNARVVRYVNYRAALEGAAALVSNGGAGSLLAALAAGVPALVLPGGLDKGEAAQRLAWSGAGLRLPDPAHCSLARFRQGVRALLDAPAYRRRAQTVGRHLLDLGGAPRAAELLAALAADHEGTDR